MAVIVTKTFSTVCPGDLKEAINANGTITTNLEQIVYAGGATTDFYFANALSGPEDTELDNVLASWVCPPPHPTNDEDVDDTAGPDTDTVWTSDKITNDFVNVSGDTMTGALTVGDITTVDQIVVKHDTNAQFDVTLDPDGLFGAPGFSISKGAAGGGFMSLMPNSETLQWIGASPSAANGVNRFFFDVDNQGVMYLNVLGGAGKFGAIVATNNAPLYPAEDGNSDLGRATERWNEIHGVTLYGDGSNLTNITITASQVDATGITDGFVLTADGLGNAAWEAQSSGAAPGAVSKVMNTWTLLSGTLYYNDFVHSLDTTDISIFLRETVSNRGVYPEYFEVIDSNTVRVVVEGNLEDLTCTVVTGKIGPQGPQGIQGIQGIQGDTGPQGPPGPASQLNELTDVNTSTPTNRNVLVADGVDWESRALVEADISDLGTYLENVVEDTTPQLGGDLDMNQKNIEFSVPSTDLTGSGIIVTGTVDVNAQGIGAPLYMAADGNFETTDADSASTMPCRALALETGVGSKKVLLQGFIRNNAWTWTPGGDMYISVNTGEMTQTVPSGEGDQVQKVGFAWNADVVYFNPGDYTIVEVN